MSEEREIRFLRAAFILPLVVPLIAWVFLALVEPSGVAIVPSKPRLVLYC